MNAQLFVDIFLAILPVAVGVVTYLNAQKASKAQSEAAEAEVDAQAYDRAKTLYESVIQSLTREADRMREQNDRQITLMNAEIGKLQESNSKLRNEIIEMQRSNTELRTRVIELQASNSRLEAEVRILRSSNKEAQNGTSLYLSDLSPENLSSAQRGTSQRRGFRGWLPRSSHYRRTACHVCRRG